MELKKKALESARISKCIENYRKNFANKGADARHAESREAAERIKQWWLENKDQFRSLDAAAEAATRIEPIGFRTARKHIGNAAKYLRSASRVQSLRA